MYLAKVFPNRQGKKQKIQVDSNLFCYIFSSILKRCNCFNLGDNDFFVLAAPSFKVLNSRFPNWIPDLFTLEPWTWTAVCTLVSRC